MKKYFLSAISVLATLFVFAQEQSVSEWAKSSITVDGNASEWNLPLKHFDSGTKLFFEIKNDDKNLYLCFQNKDLVSQEKMIKAGMKIILSSKINGKHKASIDFPLPVKKDSISSTTVYEINSDPELTHQKMHATFLAGDSLMEVNGFAGKDGIISSHDTSDIHAAINWDQENTLTYEIAIPLKEMFGNNYAVKNISKNISMEVIINALKKTGRSGYGGRNGGGGGGRMGGGGFGRGMGGMGIGGIAMGGLRNGTREFQPGKSAMSEKDEMKEKFTLAKNTN